MRLRSLRWVGQSVTCETGLPGSAQSGVWRVRAHRDSVQQCETTSILVNFGGCRVQIGFVGSLQVQ